MKDEIKEILVISTSPARDIQEFSRYFKSYIDKCESHKIYMKNGYILRFHSSHNLNGVRKHYLYHEIFETYLKNCITNLQEENEKLKELEKYTMKEITRLTKLLEEKTNIIEELEKEINNQLTMTRRLDKYNEGYFDATLNYYNKLKELKEGKK